MLQGFALDSSGQWTEAGRMSRPRAHSERIVWNSSSLLVTGGSRTGSGPFSSTELLTITESDQTVPKYSVTSSPAPDLPIHTSEHCLVKLNDSTAFLTGGFIVGRSTGARRTTYFLDLDSDLDQEEFDSYAGPELATARYGHVCGMLVNPGDGSDAVVVVTTGHNGGILSSTEMWTVGSDRWIGGPRFSVAIYYATGTTSPDSKSLLVVGGTTFEYQLSAIRKLSFEDGSWQWTKLEQELLVPRSSHVAMLIPDSLTNCTIIEN